jgi:hypothetical protein
VLGFRSGSPPSERASAASTGSTRRQSLSATAPCRFRSMRSKFAQVTHGKMSLNGKFFRLAHVFVVVGDSGIGPWQDIELRGFISVFANRRCRIIPVLGGKQRRYLSCRCFWNSSCGVICEMKMAVMAKLFQRYVTNRNIDVNPFSVEWRISHENQRGLSRPFFNCGRSVNSV